MDAPVLRWHISGETTETLYYTTDANWNVTALVAPSGHVVERYMYDAYGKATVLDGENGYDADGQVTEWSPDAGGVSDWGNTRLYAGYGLDAETGLYRTQRREYHCSLGAFIERDPGGYIDGMSLYEYVSSNPAAATDPTGLCKGAGTTAPDEALATGTCIIAPPGYGINDSEDGVVPYDSGMEMPAGSWIKGDASEHLEAAAEGVLDLFRGIGNVVQYVAEGAHYIADGAYAVAAWAVTGKTSYLDAVEDEHANNAAIKMANAVDARANAAADRVKGAYVENGAGGAIGAGAREAVSLVPVVGTAVDAIENGQWAPENTRRATSDAVAIGGTAVLSKAAKIARLVESVEVAANPSGQVQAYLSGSGGRWGGSATRALNDRIATQFEQQGFNITGGAGRAAEEWIRGPGGGTLGGTWVDITATKGGTTLRMQTYTTLADGITPKAAEAAAAARIRATFPNDRLCLIPK